MGSLDNMKRSLRPIGMYSLNISDNVNKELRTYSAEFDELTQDISKAIGECFLQTAEDTGLEVYERMIGAPRDDLDLSQRREMLRTLFNVSVNDYTPSGVQRFFDSLGFECDITEDPQHYEMLIVPGEREYSPVEREYINARAAAFLPCHLTFTIEFRTIDWDGYDALEKSFDEWDALDLSWNELDKYEEE